MGFSRNHPDIFFRSSFRISLALFPKLYLGNVSGIPVRFLIGNALQIPLKLLQISRGIRCGKTPGSLAGIPQVFYNGNYSVFPEGFLRAVTANIPSENACEILAKMLGEILVGVPEGIVARIHRDISREFG